MSNLARLVWVLLTLCCGGQAFAHASLVSSTPADGAIVGGSPSSAILRFNEPVAVTSVQLTSSDGAHLGLAPEVKNEEVILPLPPGLPAGSQVISYRVISADGHPVSGSVVFSIGLSTPAPVASSSQALGLDGAIWSARWALYVGLFGAVGGAFFANWIAPRETPAPVLAGLRAAGAMGALCMVVSVGLQGADMRGESVSELLSASAWTDGALTSLGASMLVGVVACALAIGALRPTPNGYTRAAAALALAGAGLAFSLTGHASVAAPQWLMRPAVFLHVIGAAYWLGSLYPLTSIVRASGAKSFPVVRRFSGGAVVAVSGMVLAGVVMSVVQIGSWPAIGGTDYGRLWIGKLVLVLAMLSLATANRLALTPALVARKDGARWLVRSTLAEIALAGAILAVVAGWRFTPPPRAQVVDKAPAIHVHLHGLKAMADVEIRPGRAGPVEVRATVLSGDFQPVDPKELILLFRNSGAGIEPIERAAKREPDGAWVAQGVVLPAAGIWTVRAEVLISDFEKEMVEADFDLPR